MSRVWSENIALKTAGKKFELPKKDYLYILQYTRRHFPELVKCRFNISVGRTFEGNPDYITFIVNTTRGKRYEHDTSIANYDSKKFRLEAEIIMNKIARQVRMDETHELSLSLETLL